MCQNCGKKCYDAKKLKQHEDAKSCKTTQLELSVHEPELMTPAQEKVLKRGFDADCTDENKWKLMYEELFVRDKRADSPDPCEANSRWTLPNAYANQH